MMGDPAEPVGAGSATFTVTGNPAINLRSLSVARSPACTPDFARNVAAVVLV
jgi:hypothetical protein